MTAAAVIHGGVRLSELLEGLARVPAGTDLEVSGLALDSRAVSAGDLFLAVAGGQAHGLEYATQAVAAGAVAVAWEPTPDLDEAAPALRELPVPAVAVEGLGARVSEIAGRFYGHPSADLFMVGVTGTDGKTSCSHFIAQALGGGEPCGLVGTLGYGLYGRLRQGTHTTPDPVRLQAELAEIRDQGAAAAVMEVSSHALDQHRAAAVRFDVAVLTNLGRDHLDYHGTLAAYAEAKGRLFRHAGLKAAVLNLDDAFGRELLAALPDGVEGLGYSLTPGGARAAGRWLEAEVTSDGEGLHLAIASDQGQGELRVRLLGRFNASNLLAALGVLLVRGLEFDEALARLRQVRTVPGRMEVFGGGRQPLVVVDYAHTPQALEQVLQALREHCRGQLWCIFGAGGDRDPGKRPLMGAVAERLADHVMITDDNPRHEDATRIVMDILDGMQAPDAAYIERDRGQAIARVLAFTGPGDVVLVAGKGHEEFQLVGDERIPFSDRRHVQILLGEGQS